MAPKKDAQRLLLLRAAGASAALRLAHTERHTEDALLGMTDAQQPLRFCVWTATEEVSARRTCLLKVC